MATTNPETREEKIKRIQQQAEKDGLASFHDSRFAPLDLSSHPSLTPLPNSDDDPFTPDPKFAQLDKGPVSLPTKLFELIKQANAGDVEAAEMLKAAGVQLDTKPATVYLSGQKATIRKHGGKWILEIGDIEYESGIGEDRDDFITGVAREIADASKPGYFELTPSQKLFIARQAAAGDIETALVNYVTWRLGSKRSKEETRKMESDPYAFVTDPRYRDLHDEAAFEIWALKTDGYLRDRDVVFNEWVERTAQEKPLTVKLLDGLWLQYLDYRERHAWKENSRLFNPTTPEPEPVTEQDLDALSDEEIRRLHTDTMTALAKSRKA